MKVRIVVQARTDSRRLPAKSLLPVAGHPLAVLAAKRAGNAGHDVVLATSDRPVDDELARLAARHHVRTVRGPADDVRARVLLACADLDDRDVVARLTADNLLPDGNLVAELVADLGARRPLISTAGQQPNRLPYGIAAAVMRARTLRDSVSWRDDRAAREHVTSPILEREPEAAAPIEHGMGDLRHLRCTVDTFSDYLRILELFDGVGDPVPVPWRDLVDRLSRLPGAPLALSPGPGLVLGTAQLTRPYGTVARTTPPSLDAAVRMIRRAIAHGAQIDTARAYGSSEQVVGAALEGGWLEQTHVLTKLDPLTGLEGERPAVARLAAEQSVLRSVLALGQRSSPSILLHRAAHRTAWDGAVWLALQELRADGLVSRLGASVAGPDQLLDALRDPEVEVVQLAANLLDHRWRSPEVVAARRERPDVEIHVRSAFLQGVLLREVGSWPAVEGVDPMEITSGLDDLVRELGRLDRADLCIAWLRGAHPDGPWIDRVVVGMESESQLDANLRYWARRPLDVAEVQRCTERLPRVPERVLDPASWPAPE